MKIFNIEEKLENTHMKVIEDGVESEYISNETMYKILVFHREGFQEFLKNHNITNTEEVEDCAFISIVDGYPFLKENSNSISLQFLDMPADLICKDGRELRSISMEEAERLAKFIKDNFYKNFIVHCEAGVSRSQQVAKYIELLGNHYYDEKLSSRSKMTCYQMVVLRKLLQAHEHITWWWGGPKENIKYDKEKDEWYEIGEIG